MRKVSHEDENLLDNFILDTGQNLMPYLKNSGHTPNMLTTYSFILGLSAVYFLHKGDIFNFGLCFLTSYIFDCWDGLMARTYNMTSQFGDLYDHITDISVGLGIAYVAYNKFKHKITFPLIITIATMTLLMQTHVACYQKKYSENGKKEKETLDAITGLCVNTNNLKFTKYFGTGIYTLFIIGLMYYLNQS